MPRGVKPQPKPKPRSALTGKVPAGLSAEAARIYKALAAELAVEGYAAQTDWRTVAMVANAEADVKKMEEEVGGLSSFMTVGSAGQSSVHPLVKELRTQRAALANLYGALLMTPRSRSSAKITEQQARTAASKGDSLEDFLNE